MRPRSCLAAAFWLILTCGQPLAAQSPITQVSVGASHVLALREDGSVLSWGANQFGQLGDGTRVNRTGAVLVPGLTDVLAVSAGSTSVAVRRDGSVWQWGRPSADPSLIDNAPVQIEGLNGIVAVETGDLGSIALGADGAVWTWPHFGTPEAKPSLAGVVKINLFARIALALASDGTVWRFGNGQGGFDGPALIIDGLTDVADIAAGTNHFLARTRDGSVWTWTSPDFGATMSVPVPVPDLGDVSALSAGDDFSAALRSDGTVLTWGDNLFGRLGAGLPPGDYGDSARYPPAPVVGLTGVSSLDLGRYQGIAVLPGGSVRVWGSGAFGHFGDGTTASRTLPVRVGGLHGITRLAAGPTFALALGDDRRVWSWGVNRSGEVGDGTTTPRLAPAPVSSLMGIADIAAAAASSLAVTTSGDLYGWGENSFGQLGGGASSVASVLIPSASTALPALSQAKIGYWHGLGLDRDGAVWTWGYNRWGQLGNGTTIDTATPAPVAGLASVTAIAASPAGSAALRSDGSLWTWGRDPSGGPDLTVPTMVAGLTNVVAMASSGSHILALKDDGSLWAWGDNTYGQLGNGHTGASPVPSPVIGLARPVLGISAGEGHSLAVREDGTVWAWGFGEYGALGNGGSDNRPQPTLVPGLAGAVAVEAGPNFSFAQMEDGTVWAWGDDSTGQLGQNESYVENTPIPGGKYLTQTAIKMLTPAAGAPGKPYLVSFSVTSWAGDPTGNVTINDGAHSCLATVQAGACEPIAPSTPHPIVTAHYEGDSRFASSYDLAPYPTEAAGLPGASKPGFYREGLWSLDVNADGVFETGTDRSFFLGFPGAQPVRGDWDGDGRTDVGVFAAGYWFLDYDGDGHWDGGTNDKQFAFGWAGVTPVVGDWNGDGRDSVGVHSNGFWFLDYDGDALWDGGTTDKVFGFGGWDGVEIQIGDWNGDGRDKLGLYANGFWFLDYDGDYVWDGGTVDKIFPFGWAGAKPLVGNWNGDGRDAVAVYANGFWFFDYDGDSLWNPSGADRTFGLGWPGAQVVVGDWNGDGHDKAGVFGAGNWFLDYDGSGTWNPLIDVVTAWGRLGDIPFPGVW